MQEFWYLGLGPVLQRLFANPEWVTSRTRAAACARTPADLRGAEMCAKVDAATEGKLLKEPSCGIELGFDFCQIFNFAQHSTGCMFVRYMLPHHCKHAQLLGSADCSYAAMSSTRCWQASAGLRSIKLAGWHGVCAVSSVLVGFQDGAQPGVHMCCVLQVCVGSLRLCK